MQDALEKGNNLYSSPQTEQMCQKVTNDYTKTEEYNAYLFQAYYNDPEMLLKNYPEDFELIDETVKIFDPSFDAFQKYTLRKQLLEK